jgi:hypothetical protein
MSPRPDLAKLDKDLSTKIGPRLSRVGLIRVFLEVCPVITESPNTGRIVPKMAVPTILSSFVNFRKFSVCYDSRG